MPIRSPWSMTVATLHPHTGASAALLGRPPPLFRAALPRSGAREARGREGKRHAASRLWHERISADKEVPQCVHTLVTFSVVACRC